MSKPEPLFPSAAHCPACNKKIRIKWAAPRDFVGRLNGLGYMKCLHCGANHVRAVGAEDAVLETSHMIAAKYQQACGHDHEHEGHEHDHGVAVIPGGDGFAYIKFPG